MTATVRSLLAGQRQALRDRGLDADTIARIMALSMSDAPDYEVAAALARALRRHDERATA